LVYISIAIPISVYIMSFEMTDVFFIEMWYILAQKVISFLQAHSQKLIEMP
jgi:hypothetical protein